MLPSLAAIAAADTATGTAERRAQLEGSLPFSNTRLRAYSNRIDSLADSLQEDSEAGPASEPATMGLESPLVPGLAPDGSASAGASPAKQAAAAAPGDAPDGPPAWYASAIAELNGIRSEISRVESTLGALKEPQERTTLGRPVFKKAPKQQSLASPKDSFAERKKEWESQQLLSATQPVSRGEAVILEQTLEELLPAGTVTESLRPGGARRSAPAFDVHTFEKQYELVDMVLREAARQVHAGCHERGSVLEKLRVRYNEFFSAMKLLLFKLQQNYTASAKDLHATRHQCQELSKDRTRLQEESTQLKSDCDFLRARVGSLEKEFGQHKEASEEAMLNLKTDNQMLEHEVSHYEDRLSKADTEREDAVGQAVANLEDELVTIIDERDDLVQRIRFLERQLAKAREERQRAVPVDHATTQTDPEDDRSLEDSEDDEDDQPADKTSARSRPKTKEQKEKKKKKKSTEPKGKPEEKKSKRILGGFESLLKSDRVGRIKPKGQIVKIISQIYAEKIVVDQVDDREMNPRSTLAVFVYDWHLNRYGLRNLAEMNLLDLIASCRHYYKDNLKIRLFGQFCGLFEERNHTLEHLNFYLYCMQVISPNVTALFPDTEDMIYWLKPLRVLDVIRIVYPNLVDSTQLRDFMTARVEPLMDAKTKMYDVDAVLLLLLEEWQRRAERNMAHLRALFRAGDLDEDGLLTYDEFLAVVRHADSLRSEREILRMYREALHMSQDGETIDVDAFVMVARSHGLSSWKIDYRISGVPQCQTPPQDAKRDDTLFQMLDNVIESSDSLDDQIAELNSKLGADHETMVRIHKQHNFFLSKYKERDDSEGSWLAYRVLIGELRASMVRYRGGLKRVVGLVKNSLAFVNRENRANSTYTSPLLAMLQQSKEEAGTGNTNTYRSLSGPVARPGAVPTMPTSRSAGASEQYPDASATPREIPSEVAPKEMEGVEPLPGEPSAFGPETGDP